MSSKWKCEDPYDPSSATAKRRGASCVRSETGEFSERQQCVEVCVLKEKEKEEGEMGLELAVVPEGRVEELGPEESEPELSVFPSKHAKPGPREVARVPANVESVASLRWVGCYGTIESSGAAVVFQLTCARAAEAEEGVRRYSRREAIGEAVVPLGELVRRGRKEGSVLVSLKDKSRDGAPLLRLRTRVRVLKFRSTSALTTDPFDFEKLGKARKRCARIVDEFFAFYGKHDPLVQEIWNIHVPRFPTFGGKLPSAIYRLERPEERIPGGFADHVLGIAADMAGWTPDEFVRTVREQLSSPKKYLPRTNVAASIVGRAVVLTATSMDYFSDVSAGKDVERMFVARAFLADDCEGLAAECAMLADDLADGPENASALAAAASVLLRRYAIVMTTVMASSPSASAKSEAKDEIICHINAFAVPRTHLAKMLPPGIAKKFRACYDPPAQPWEEGLPVLTFEGTAPCNVELLPALTYVPPSERKELALQIARRGIAKEKVEERHPGLKSLVLEIQQSNFDADPAELTVKTASTFYRYVIDAWIDLRKCGVSEALDFSVGYRSKSREAGKHVYGVTFMDWISKSEDVELVPTYSLVPRDWEAFGELEKYSYPVPQWKAPEPSPRPSLVPSEAGRRPYLPPFVSYRVNRVEKLTVAVEKAVAAAEAEGMASFERIRHDFGSGLYLIELRMRPKVDVSSQAEAFLTARAKAKSESRASGKFGSLF